MLTIHYLEVVEEAMRRVLDREVYIFHVDKIDYSRIHKKDYILVADIITAVKFLVRGYENFIIWYQGLAPEESFLKNNSRLRRMVLSYWERYTLRAAKFHIFISNDMKEHYKLKYGLANLDPSYIMPCFNAVLDEIAFAAKNKYTKNVFTYVGSLARYQGFERILEVYRDIEIKYGGQVELRMFSKQWEEAALKIKELGIQHFKARYARQEELNKELYEAKFGFITREEHIVDRVATPTKISTYLACGVIPIYSNSIRDFAERARHMNYAVSIDAEDYENKLAGLINTEIDRLKILAEYKGIFSDYYSRDWHVRNLCKEPTLLLNN